jgi:hypothetical protein
MSLRRSRTLSLRQPLPDHQGMLAELLDRHWALEFLEAQFSLHVETLISMRL